MVDTIYQQFNIPPVYNGNILQHSTNTMFKKLTEIIVASFVISDTLKQLNQPAWPRQVLTLIELSKLTYRFMEVNAISLIPLYIFQ